MDCFDCEKKHKWIPYQSGFRMQHRIQPSWQKALQQWWGDARDVDGVAGWLYPPWIPAREIHRLHQIVVTSIFGFFRTVTSSPQLCLRGKGGDLKLPFSDWGVNDSNPVNALTVCSRWVSGYGPRKIERITPKVCELQRVESRIWKHPRCLFMFHSNRKLKNSYLRFVHKRAWLTMINFVLHGIFVMKY